ncbi:MAG: hypothetical protein JOZ72_12775 [Alphaproteobacteria bacterium]|nr:hypothetical protein [Alphaproteobacteria bacterium]
MKIWVAVFVLLSMVPIGSLALLLTHGISGGRWGKDFAPVLVPAARAMPLLFLVFLPVVVFRPQIYDWSALKLPHDVYAYYLNPPFFDARTLVGLALWSAMAWGAPWRNPALAGIGLSVHFVLMMFLPADWVLTLAPGSVSAGFGMGFGIEQMFAALALVAVLAPQEAGRSTRDLAGLVVSTLLGVVYFMYMAFLITWYGNVPEKIHWYVVRAGTGWPSVMLAAFLIGAVVPFLAVLSPAVRREPRLLRLVGLLALFGIVLHAIWLILPGDVHAG